MVAWALALAWGANGLVPVQGVLVGDDGQPLQGTHTVGVALRASSAGANPVWDDALTASFADGAFVVGLGSGRLLDLAIFGQHTGWTVTFSVDGGVPSAPVSLGHAPLAAHADNASALGGHPASAYARFGGPAWDWSTITWSNAPSWLSGYVGGAGVSVSGNTIAANLTAGPGISVSGGTISSNLTAGPGISVSGGTISSNLTAGPGISVSGGTISSNLTAGSGISVSGGTVSSALAFSGGLTRTGNDVTAVASDIRQMAVPTNISRGTACASAGQLGWDPAAQGMFVCNGTAWVELGARKLPTRLRDVADTDVTAPNTDNSCSLSAGSPFVTIPGMSVAFTVDRTTEVELSFTGSMADHNVLTEGLHCGLRFRIDGAVAPSANGDWGHLMWSTNTWRWNHVGNALRATVAPGSHTVTAEVRTGRCSTPAAADTSYCYVHSDPTIGLMLNVLVP